MKYIIKFIIASLIILCSKNLNAQILLVEGFEAPLIAWYNEGIVVTSQNSVLPYSGSAMNALGRNERITSPNFNLPVGSKTLTFFMNGYNPYSPLGFAMEVQLMQNGNPSLLLGSFSSVTNWGQKTINIPSGYSGSNYSIDFHVLNYSSTYSNFKFYIDDILVEQNGVIGISEIEKIDNYFSLSLQPGKLIIQHESKDEVNFVELITISGQVICRKTFQNSSSTEINLNDLSSGLYLAHISDGKKSFVKKLIL